MTGQNNTYFISHNDINLDKSYMQIWWFDTRVDGVLIQNIHVHILTLCQLF